MIDIYNFDFTGKIVLEIGTGRGGTTLELAKAMKGFKGAKLITTDIYDKNFEELREELLKYDIDVSFIKTDACKLDGIEENLADVVVCNYTLCAVGSKSGREIIALNRFKEVLKPKGILYMEEEYPIDMAFNSMQQVWSRKWQLLRAANMLLGELSFNEIAPETLKNVLCILGFSDIQYENVFTKMTGENCLEFFNYRFNKSLNKLNNKKLAEGLKSEGATLEENLKKAGGMEAPAYKITAVK